MAHLPVITDVFRCALDWSDGSSAHAENVMHFRPTSAGKTSSQVFTCLDAHVTQNMWDSVGSAWGVDTVSITPLDGATATQVFATARPTKWQGGGGTETVPAASGLVKLTTSTRGRSYRGRVFLPNTSELQQDNGFLSGAVVTAMQTAWNAFLTAVSADATTPMHLGIASYKLSQFTDVSGVVCETALATQRRRQSRLR